ncbi:MAG: hypothetical protein KGP06_02975 [Acidobacteria bacterium]|nr:hypothetical protein [Acidobacteriota bacterium]
MAISIYALCFGMAASSIFSSSATVHNKITSIAWALLVAQLARLIFLVPKITFFDEGIKITNPHQEITVGWHLIDEVHALYTMYIEVGSKRINAWAAQTPGRYHARSIHPSELRGLKLNGVTNIRPGESPRTYSGIAVQLARVRLETFNKSGNQARIPSEVISNTSGIALVIANFTICALLIIFRF